MSDNNLVKVGSGIPRAVGEVFRAIPCGGGAAVKMRVVKVVSVGGVIAYLLCKVIGG